MSETDTSEERWRRSLSREQYRVTREGGTEPAFSGCYWDHHEDGLYRCVCCDAPLFRSETKYDSGSGWPSYWQPAEPDAVRELIDESHGMVRIEVRCAGCGAHLGHRFPDGPPPTGQRYCINSAALRFEPLSDKS